MSDHMGVRVELWVVAADQAGIWLLNGDDAWRSDRISADEDVHAEVELLAYGHAPDLALSVIHSTSWRQDGPGIVLTYVAIGQAGEFVQDRWPHALPITTQLLELVGRPYPHDAAQAPVPRHLDVLVHSVRHLRFLRDTDAPTRDAMSADWRQHLEAFEPALAGLYSEPHVA
jgi:hypothetical protein